MIGRESKESNDLFYTCSLIDYIARKTKNTRQNVVNALGLDSVKKIYELADVYQCDRIETVAEEFIEEAKIQVGIFDNVAECHYSIPTHWDMGKVYKRLIQRVAKEKQIDLIDALFEVYNSFISVKIDDYNSSVYYENPDNLLIAFLEGSFEYVY